MSPKFESKLQKFISDNIDLVAEYESISAAGRALCKPGKNPRAIANHICKQKDTQNVCHGFLWRTSIEDFKKEIGD